MRIAIVDGARTPFCKAGTALDDVPAQELGRVAVQELLQRTEIDPGLIDEVIIGNVAQPAEAANIARVIAVNAGLPREVPAYTVNRNCASAFQSITSAWEKIASGQAEVVIAGGTESMSNVPWLFRKELKTILSNLARRKKFWQTLAQLRPRHYKPVIGLEAGLTDPLSGLIMGGTAEVLAKEFNISRQEQDQYALLSHQRSSQAIKTGRFGEEIVPVYVPPKYQCVDQDIGPRANQTLAALAGLRPYFDRGEYGTVTVGNSSQITDGAAAVLVASENKAGELGCRPLGYIRSFAYAGVDPGRMGLGPSRAAAKALKLAGLKLQEVELIELNEAFAAVVIANEISFKEQGLGRLRREIMNVNGGAIALGHPVGATGTRLVITLLKEMKRRDLKLGLATLCIGGGQGGAIILER